ncbi:MAG: nuclear transport factor 2 family protein [Deltaproteobacteria bacterium]|nr:nuclear transport factor 2 family protein [Deltaproteobacteria bacterium]
MSPTERPNVVLVRSIYDAFARRDVPAVFALFDEDIAIDQSREVPWGGAYRGREQALQFFAALTGNITSRVVLERCIDAGDHVVAIGRTQGTVNATGRAFDVPVAHVWHLREGRVLSVQFCIDNPTMRAALD